MDTGKYGQEITPYLDTFHAMLETGNYSEEEQNQTSNQSYINRIWRIIENLDR